MTKHIPLEIAFQCPLKRVGNCPQHEGKGMVEERGVMVLPVVQAEVELHHYWQYANWFYLERVLSSSSFQSVPE
jgi:hypothetical protein